MDSDLKLATLRSSLEQAEHEAAMNLARLELKACRVVADAVRLVFPDAQFVELGPGRHGGCVPVSVRDEDMVAVLDGDGDRVMDVVELARSLVDETGDVLDLVVDAAESLSDDGSWTQWVREQNGSTPVAQTFLDLRMVDAEADSSDRVDEISVHLAAQTG